MKSKIVLITGGACGMGRETALALGAMGAEALLLLDWEGEASTRTRDEVNRAAGRPQAEFIYTDFSDLTVLKELAMQLLESVCSGGEAGFWFWYFVWVEFAGQRRPHTYLVGELD